MTVVDRRAEFAQRFPGAIILPFKGAWPTIDDSAFVAPGAVVIGNVSIGAGTSIWFNTTVRGDIAPITIGSRSNIQDGTLVHVNEDAPVVIGDDVTVGHTAIIHGTVIGDRVLVGMGAIIMSYSLVGEGSVIAAGALISERVTVPPGAVMVGVPAKERSRLDDGQAAHLAAIPGRYVEVSRVYRDELAGLHGLAEGVAAMVIDVERRDHLAIVTINRPDKLNALDADGLRDIRARFDELSADRAIRAIILTGAGDRAFVAGADIAAMAAYTEEEGREFGALGHAATRAIELAAQPVIAAVNGFALGGGCELALACDIRIASKNAVFAQPEVSLGIPPGWGGSQRLPRVVGPGVAAELIFTGRRVEAVEALRIGLINSVYDSEKLMPAASALAGAIAANSPANVRSAKRLIALTRDPDQAGLDAEAAAFAQAFTIPDRKEGMTAFIERRKASFVDGDDA